MKKQKLLLTALVGLFAMATVGACSDDPVNEPVLTIDRSAIDAPVEAGSYPVAVTSNLSWTVAVDAAATWCTVSPASGEGNGTIAVAVMENPAITPRAATVTITAGTLAKTVIITQASESPVLSVTETVINAAFTASSYSVAVTSNLSWTADVDAATTWCTVLPASGEGDGTINVTLIVNPADARSTIVTVRATNAPDVALEKAVRVEQASVNEEQGVTIADITWATRNVSSAGYFATSPGESGKYYQYGRNEPGVEASYTPAAGAWSQSATDPCPAGWRLPTEAEILKLTGDHHMTISWRASGDADNYGVEGIWCGDNAAAATAADPKGCVFLPAAGYIDPVTGETIYLDDDGVWYGYYYAGTENEDLSMYGYMGYLYLTIGGPLTKGGVYFPEVSTYFIICPPMAWFGMGDRYIASTLRCVKR
ncbi:MAG: hypothetical protein LBD91_02035 [Prevotellaceae bacterium]|nr:hypothetical protein [Prevotellaceae bacterium]